MSSEKEMLPRNAQEAPPPKQPTTTANGLSQMIAKGADFYQRLSTNDVLEFKKFTKLNQYQRSAQIVYF